MRFLLCLFLAVVSFPIEATFAGDPIGGGVPDVVNVNFEGEQIPVKIVRLPGGDIALLNGDPSVILGKNPADKSFSSSIIFVAGLQAANPNLSQHWQILIGHGTLNGTVSSMSTANGAQTTYIPIDQYGKQVEPLIRQSPAPLVFVGHCFGGIELVPYLALQHPNKTFVGANCERNSGSTGVGPAEAPNYVSAKFDPKTNTLHIYGGTGAIVPKGLDPKITVVHEPTRGLNAVQMNDLLKATEPAKQHQALVTGKTGPTGSTGTNGTGTQSGSTKPGTTNPTTRLNSVVPRTPLVIHGDVIDGTDGSKKLQLIMPIGIMTVDLQSSCQPWDLGKPCIATQILPIPLSKAGFCTFRKGWPSGMICEYDSPDQTIRDDSHIMVGECAKQWFEFAKDPNANRSYKLHMHLSLWAKGAPSIWDPKSFGIGKRFADQCGELIKAACRAAPDSLGCEPERDVKFDQGKLDPNAGQRVADGLFESYLRGSYAWAFCAKYDQGTPQEHCSISQWGINACESRARSPYQLTQNSGNPDAQADWDLFMNGCMDWFKILCDAAKNC